MKTSLALLLVAVMLIAADESMEKAKEQYDAMKNKDAAPFLHGHFQGGILVPHPYPHYMINGVHGDTPEAAGKQSLVKLRICTLFQAATFQETQV